MPTVNVQKLEAIKTAATPVLEEVRATFDQIRKRAFELFERRGGAPGFDVEDWVRAEQELFWVPQAELAETDNEYTIKVGVPGFDAKDLNVTAASDEILIRGEASKREERTGKGIAFSEFGTKSLFRRFALPAPIDIGGMTANVENGMLTMIVPKKKESAKKIAVAA